MVIVTAFSVFSWASPLAPLKESQVIAHCLSLANNLDTAFHRFNHIDTGIGLSTAAMIEHLQQLQCLS
jgi:hypothetical protein